MVRALRFAANGEKDEKAKPFKGVGSGVFEVALAYKGDAFRLTRTTSRQAGYLG